MIIIEGHDNSGKSTLAKLIADEFGCPIQESEGPPKYPGELNDRILRYTNTNKKNTVYVRHPCVSEPIYGTYCRPDQPSPIMPELIESFYAQRHIFVYCDPLDRGLTEHNIKAGEDPTHLSAVQRQYALILGAYRIWAIGHAHIMYRIGDSTDQVLNLLCGDVMPAYD